MAHLSSAARGELPGGDFGDPENREFPVENQAHVDAAAHLIGKAKNPEAVKKRIIEIARRKGLRVPSSWQKPGLRGSKKKVGVKKR